MQVQGNFNAFDIKKEGGAVCLRFHAERNLVRIYLPLGEFPKFTEQVNKMAKRLTSQRERR